MPRNVLTKDEIRAFVLKQKKKLNEESIGYTSDPRSLANKYLNLILDRIEEYRI
jgi:hypothetical protein